MPLKFAVKPNETPSVRSIHAILKLVQSDIKELKDGSKQNKHTQQDVKISCLESQISALKNSIENLTKEIHSMGNSNFYNNPRSKNLILYGLLKNVGPNTNFRNIVLKTG